MEEQKIWHMSPLLCVPAESVEIKHLALAVRRFLVEAFKQSAVQKRHAPEKFQHLFFRDGEFVLLAIERLDSVLLLVGDDRPPVTGKISVLDLVVKRGEKKVLQDDAVVVVLRFAL